jgi:hypothetical protein
MDGRLYHFNHWKEEVRAMKKQTNFSPAFRISRTETPSPGGKYHLMFISSRA